MSAKPKFRISDEELDGLLFRYTRDVTEQDRNGKFDPVTGRDSEVDRMVLVLLQRLRKNVLLIGGAGVGKTACFVALSQLINANKVPVMLQGARVIELEMSMIGAGSASRSDLEGRLIPIVRGVAERNATYEKPPIIFCIDEIHQLTVGFTKAGYSGIIDLLKPYLTAGDLYVVGATTREEYDDYVTADPAIDRRFQKIELEQPNMKQTYDILLKLKENFEKHYKITISPEACERIVRLTDRFMRNRNNPDKSILSLDQACARALKDGDGKQLDDVSINQAVASEANIDSSALVGKA
jgi:ATP-dependent Clp protease ATP-binding subunit ClpA